MSLQDSKTERNRKNRKGFRKHKEDGESIRKELALHAEGLAAEMSLRLFLDGDGGGNERNMRLLLFLRKLPVEAGLWDIWQELCAPDTFLLVEKIEITDIHFPEKGGMALFLKRLGIRFNKNAYSRLGLSARRSAQMGKRLCPWICSGICCFAAQIRRVGKKKGRRV